MKTTKKNPGYKNPQEDKTLKNVNKAGKSRKKQKEATLAEIPYSHTIGRHGTDDEKELNPEE
jgi:hypothetical protein